MKLNEETITHRVADFVKGCKAKGLSLTHQRLAVYKSLAATTAHPTAEEVYEEISDQVPTISLATVYKTLETFEKFGFISKIRSIGESARFDANLESHHHLICKVCGKIEDVYDHKLDNLSTSRSKKAGFMIEDYRVNFYGKCQSCHN